MKQNMNEKYKDLDVNQKLQMVEKMKRGLVCRQKIFMKAKSKNQAAVKTSFIVAAEIAKSARPSNEGGSMQKCMVKVCDIACPDSKTF